MFHPSTLSLPLLLPLLLPQATAPLGGGRAQDPKPGAQDPVGPELPTSKDAAEALQRAFEAAGVRIDRAAGVLSFPAEILVRDELLEYLLVNPHGAVHESLFVADVPADVLNAALLALGLQRGQNVQYVQKDPPPTPDELRAGARAFDIVPPSGDAVQLYAAWREEGELFFFRIEDLVRDLDRGRTMRRHAWVYLGSRWIESRRGGGGPLYAATAEGNLACISFFSAGNTLLTAALPECVAQTSWLPNGWLLPPTGSQVLLIASRGPLVAPPASLEGAIPVVAAEPVPAEGGAR